MLGGGMVSWLSMSENSILLVDPFKNLQNLYQMILRDEGYLVETASDIKEAMLQFSTRHYALLITEFFPPFEETSRMIQWVKQNSPETYIIMATDTMVNDAMYGKLFEIGLDDLFLKPVSARKILTHIRKGLKQKDLILKKKELETQPFDSISQLVQQLIFSPIYFKKCFRQELKYARRHQRPFSLLIIRIPSKEDMGDQYESFYLELGNIFRKYVREEDTVGWEKGNFGIILPETGEAGSQIALKRLLNLIKTHPLFNSNEIFRTMVQTLDFESITYPEKFQVPEFLKAMVDDLDK